MSFGDQVVAVVSVSTTGTPRRLGLKDEIRTTTRVPGVHFRPLSVAEAVDVGFDVGTEVWKLTAPPGVTADLDDEVLHDGTDHPEVLTGDAAKGHTFQVVGAAQPKSDLDGSVHHVTVLCKRQAS
jgi:hypothetical protein